MPTIRTLALGSILLLLIACQHSAKDPHGKPAGSVAAAKPVDEHVNPPFAGVREMMRAKLAHAQAVLEGVARQDFDQVETNANSLHNLSTLTDWQVHRTMEYNQYSDEFRWNSRELARHAREKKLHAATLDYMSLTMTCVKCHDYMSREGLVKLDLRELVAGSADWR